MAMESPILISAVSTEATLSLKDWRQAASESEMRSSMRSRREASLSIGGYGVFDTNGILNQASGDKYAQVRVLTNTAAGAPDSHMYVNYPSRAGSLTHIYNNTDITGSLSVSGIVSSAGNGILARGAKTNNLNANAANTTGGGIAEAAERAGLL